MRHTHVPENISNEMSMYPAQSCEICFDEETSQSFFTHLHFLLFPLTVAGLCHQLTNALVERKQVRLLTLAALKFQIRSVFVFFFFFFKWLIIQLSNHRKHIGWNMKGRSIMSLCHYFFIYITWSLMLLCLCKTVPFTIWRLNSFIIRWKQIAKQDHLFLVYLALLFSICFVRHTH